MTMEPPLKRRKICHDVEGWLFVDILPGELVQIIIDKLEYDIRAIVRFSRTCKKWLQNMWSFVSHLDVTHGQPETAPKPSQYQIQPVLERIDYKRMRSLIITHKISITGCLNKGHGEFGGSNKFWVWKYIKQMTRLESLTLLSHDLPSNFFEMCTILSSLSQLTIDCSAISDQNLFMKDILYLTSLKHVSFTSGIKTIQALENLPNLVSLHVPQLPVSPFNEDFSIIVRLTQLQSLSANACIDSIMKEIVKMTNLKTFLAPRLNVREPIKEMHNLEYLKAKSVRVTYLPPNLTYLSTPWEYVLTPWLNQLSSYDGDLVDKNQLTLFNKLTNITHLSLKVSQFTYPMLTMLKSIKSLSLTDPDIAVYPTDLFLKTFRPMTSLRRIEFLVSYDETSFDIAAKFPLKDVVVSTKQINTKPMARITTPTVYYHNYPH